MRNIDQLPWRSPYTVLTLLFGVALICLGTNFLLHPHAGASGYGISVNSSEADAFLMAKGLRDAALGLAFIGLVAFASLRAVAVLMMVGTMVPVGDATIVAMTHSAPAYALPMHAITAAIMLALSLLMLNRSSNRLKPSTARPEPGAWL